MRFEPPYVYGEPGDRFYVELKNDKGEVCPMDADHFIVFTSSDRSSAHAVDIRDDDEDSDRIWPFRMKKCREGIEITLTVFQPLHILYRNKKILQETATLEVAMIPPYNHKDLSRGGPAVGRYDVFQE